MIDVQVVHKIIQVFTFEHDQVGNVVTAVDHRPVDEVLAVLDEDLLQELRIGRVDDGHRAAVPAQDLAALAERLGQLFHYKKVCQKQASHL